MRGWWESIGCVRESYNFRTIESTVYYCLGTDLCWRSLLVLVAYCPRKEVDEMLIYLRKQLYLALTILGRLFAVWG